MSDAAAALEQRIHDGIPLSRAMAFRIVALEDHAITVEAPLAENINVHGTGFAGSLYALGILTAWALCAHIIGRAGLQADLVVADATIRYHAPVCDDIRCRSTVSDSAAQAFVDTLRASGRARIGLEVAIGDPPVARIEATMHARLSG
jgi:thioesterase domain-containing protein